MGSLCPDLLQRIHFCFSYQYNQSLNIGIKMKVQTIILILSVLISSYDAFTINNPTKIGQLSNYMHNIGGTVYIDKNKIYIQGFTYDGTGPDAFFFVGESGTPNRKGTIIPYPDNGVCYDYNDESAPLLKEAFDGGRDIVLTLPCSLDVTKIKWISVWCRAYSMDFGSLMFANKLGLDENEEYLQESDYESPVEPEYYSGYSKDGEYYSANPEPEPEMEPEPVG